ncbi:pyridoxine 5'-phosphate synthase [Gammaproteobacteria bacterium]|nr:pyridoxine 5'-phosphate synthase [Gammaproteobacteria bacterium]
MKLSVNLNKIALLRNSRGSNTPSLEAYANKAISLGVDGLTLHPRTDHRHATSNDAVNIGSLCKEKSLEFNLEGNPFSQPKNEFLGFYELCLQAKPDQITFVPDGEGQLTSDSGWEPGFRDSELKSFIKKTNELTCRTSLFINADIQSVEYASDMNFDRIEIYTGPFAHAYLLGKNELQVNCDKIKEVINRAQDLGLGVNAGHDLSLDNIELLKECGPIDEVSIGHAIMTDSLKYGFDATIMKYINIIREK